MQQFEKDWETLNRGGINKQERERKKEENDRWTDRQTRDKDRAEWKRKESGGRSRVNEYRRNRMIGGGGAR